LHSFVPFSERASGVLLHVTSLPSPWGVGDLGERAHEFAQRLAAAGQRYWQTLPLNPVSTGNSPYFSPSSCAGNPMLLSIEDLRDRGLLSPEEAVAPGLKDDGYVDFERAQDLKQPLLLRAAERLVRSDDPEFLAYCDHEANWLDDHALFQALAQELGSAWRSWPDTLKFRDAAAIASAREQHAAAIEIEKALQYLFHCQWEALRKVCEGCGLAVLGDMPIYVNTDSVDVWASPETFCLDEHLNPTLESGVPPDYFSATGQLWRNPVFNWQTLERSGFSWWIERLKLLLARFDAVRIDHFRGLAQFWAVPAGADNAIDGQWMDVPSHAFFDALHAALHPLPLVAEDLGTITPDVHELRDHYGFPGMIVLQFAFNDDHYDNPYKPENHRENAIAYLGTHDNNTCRGWLDDELDEHARRRLQGYTDAQAGPEGVRAMLELLLSSRASTTIVCAQDLLALPAEARMNIPGVAEGNWRWQLTAAQFEALPLQELGDRCAAHGRSAGA
jgi:4-alpha-glucanotransferase